MATEVPSAVIALNLPKVVALLLVYGRHIVQMMTDNSWFPSPDPGLPDFAAHLDALERAEATAWSRAKGTAAARDAEKKVVCGDLRALKQYVARIANLNMELAIAIILSAGMTPKQFARRHKPPLQASMGPAPGEVIVRAKAVAKRAAYEWQISSDGASWTTFATTTVADTSVPGLTPGTTYFFRFRATRKRTTGDWSQTIKFMVY